MDVCCGAKTAGFKTQVPKPGSPLVTENLSPQVPKPGSPLVTENLSPVGQRVGSGPKLKSRLGAETLQSHLHGGCLPKRNEREAAAGQEPAVGPCGLGGPRSSITTRSIEDRSPTFARFFWTPF